MRTGYKIRTIILLVILIGGLSGCSVFGEQTELNQNKAAEEKSVPSESDELDNEEQPEQDEITIYSSAEEINALNISENLLEFYLVLNSKKPFISANEGCQEFYWNEYYWRDGSLSASFTICDFMLVDMDGDNEDEMILTGYMPETTQVLDYQEGKVYSYQFPYRGMKGILTNGVYNTSSASDIGGFYRIHFDKGTYENETLTYMEHDYYEVEGTEVTSEEFYKYTESLLNMEQVEDIDFEEELIEKNLLGDLTEEEWSVVENIATEEMTEEAIPYTAEELQVYFNVLAEGEEFICVTDERKSYYLEDNYIRSKTGDEEYLVLYFSIVDMDEDGKTEVVLSCDWDDIFILHDAGEEVRGYLFDGYDEMIEITNDGTYSFLDYYPPNYRDDGSMMPAFGRIISFGESGYEMETVSNFDEDNAERIRYYFFSDEAINQWLK